jgi:hypothetical protein
MIMTECAAPCGVELSTCNLINGDTVHADCRCLYRDCRKPLLDPLAWRRQICDDCWPCDELCRECEIDPGHRVANKHRVVTVRQRRLPEEHRLAS